MIKLFKNLTLVDISIIAVCATIILGIFTFIDMYRYEYINWPSGAASFPSVIQYDKLNKTQCLSVMTTDTHSFPYDGLNDNEKLQGTDLLLPCFKLDK